MASLLDCMLLLDPLAQGQEGMKKKLALQAFNPTVSLRLARVQWHYLPISATWSELPGGNLIFTANISGNNCSKESFLACIGVATTQPPFFR